jgi:hypothetical protein
MRRDFQVRSPSVLGLGMKKNNTTTITNEHLIDLHYLLHLV